MGKPVRQLVGERVGSLVVVEAAGLAQGRAMWRCVCDCGKEVVTSGNRLQRKTKTNCGCMTGALIGAVRRTHGHSAGGTKTKAYVRWKSMRARCSNSSRPDWKNYGGRGIKVCERWEDFEAFYADVGDSPGPEYSLDRINNDGDYEPDNVRWATRSQQQKNARFDKFQGERNGRSKLTEDDVRYIRASSASGVRLAALLNVTRTTISEIRLGKIWRKVM